MDNDDLIRALYTSSNQLMLATQALDAAGRGECARHTREAGCEVMRALAKLVKARAEQRGAVLS